MSVSLVDSCTNSAFGSVTVFQKDSSNQTTQAGQSFTGNCDKLDKVELYINKVSTDGTMVVHIYNVIGVFGTDSKPTGSPIATSDAVDVISMPSGTNWISFNFTNSNRINLSDGVHYCLELQYITGTSGNKQVVLLTPGANHAGVFSFFRETINWHTNRNLDMRFKVWGENINCFYCKLPTTNDTSWSENSGIGALRKVENGNDRLLENEQKRFLEGKQIWGKCDNPPKC